MSVTLPTIFSYGVVEGLPYGIAELFDGHTKAWYMHTEGITLSDSSVTQWNDLSGNDYHLLPYATNGSAGTTDNCPLWDETDGVTFDGSNDAMRVMIAGWTTFGTIYAIVRAVSWTNADVLFGYAGTGAVRVAQVFTAEGGTPNVHVSTASGSSLAITNFTLGTVGVLVMHTNQATPLSTLSLNGGTAVENSLTMVGYTSAGVLLGAAHAAYPALQRWGNVAIYEIIYRDQIDTGDTLTAIYDYLSTKYSI